MALAARVADERTSTASSVSYNTLDRASPWPSAAPSNNLLGLTQAVRQQLKAEYKAAAALCRKAGKQSCKALREAKAVACSANALI